MKFSRIDKLSKLTLFSSAAYIVIVAITTGAFDVLSSLIYMGVAFGIAQIAKIRYKKWTAKNIFVLGFLFSLTYHFLGLAVAWYKIPFTFIALAALEQGIVAGIVFKIMGGKK